MAKTKPVYLWETRQGSAIAAVLTLAFAYIMGSRALDTGSLIQYFLALVLLGLAINRVAKAIKG